MGFIFASILDLYSKTPQETPPAVVFFQFFWFPVLFMVPLLTMKTIADERRQGTLETLLTTPVSTAEVVLGKFSAAYLFYLLLWGSTLGFHYILQLYARDARYLDLGPLLGGYLFIAISGLLDDAQPARGGHLHRRPAHPRHPRPALPRRAQRPQQRRLQPAEERPRLAPDLHPRR
jgi:ABC-2 type transport system permease protein